MKYTILAAAAALAMTMPLCAAPAFAQAISDPPRATDQPSGGYVDNNIGAATLGLQGSTTGEGNMDGPYGNGQPDSPYPTNKEQANMRGVGSHLDPDAPPPAYIGQGADQ